jgi:hypothetical protein
MFTPLICLILLAPCDFFLFLKIISLLKGAHFVLVKEVKAKIVTLINSLRENNLQHFFEWWRHFMQAAMFKLRRG